MNLMRCNANYRFHHRYFIELQSLEQRLNADKKCLQSAEHCFHFFFLEYFSKPSITVRNTYARICRTAISKVGFCCVGHSSQMNPSELNLPLASIGDLKNVSGRLLFSRKHVIVLDTLMILINRFT